MFSSQPLILSVIATALLVSHAIGQEVIEGSENLFHLRPMDYPTWLRLQGVHGTVELEITLDEKGRVIDPRVVSGPTKLR